MKIQINNSTGEVVFYPVTEPSPRAGFTIIEVTPAIQSVIDQGGPFKWQKPEPVDGPLGPVVNIADGTLIKVERPDRVPQSVTPLQLDLALAARGIDLDSVPDQITDPAQRSMAQKYIAKATEYRRDNPMVTSLATIIGYDQDDVAAVFIEASKIQP